LYLAKTPGIVKPVYKDLVWNISTEKKEVFLTFDDGPTLEITDQTLDILASFKAKATFFCVGKNIAEHPELYARILAEGHQTGNHTNDHVNGWKTTDYTYFKNVLQCDKFVQSNLFRPPYGKIKRSQTRALKNRFDIIMWDVLSGDFDTEITAEQCLKNVVKHTTQGSIIVFHDSVKAGDKMLYALPRFLEEFSKNGYQFSAIPA
jgi:peptidoglycan/xylan/chitin deacetylase (PgdA/CDA1 family)